MTHLYVALVEPRPNVATIIRQFEMVFSADDIGRARLEVNKAASELGLSNWFIVELYRDDAARIRSHL
jgi:hypothetical protein